MWACPGFFFLFYKQVIKTRSSFDLSRVFNLGIKKTLIGMCWLYRKLKSFESVFTESAFTLFREASKISPAWPKMLDVKHQFEFQLFLKETFVSKTGTVWCDSIFASINIDRLKWKNDKEDKPKWTMWLYFSGLADSRFGFLLGYCFPAKVSSFKIASYFHGTFKRPN